MKCQICKEEQAAWSWQPFGPGETPNEYALIGSHTRGFPVIKVGDVCKNAFQTGDFEVKFSYEGCHFIGKNHQVKEIHVSLWNGGTTALWPDTTNETATMIMKDSIGPSELAALVLDPELIKAFVIAPRLLEACQELDKLYNMIARHLDFIHVPKADRDAILMALAKIHVEMETDQIA